MVAVGRIQTGTIPIKTALSLRPTVAEEIEFAESKGASGGIRVIRITANSKLNQAQQWGMAL